MRVQPAIEEVTVKTKCDHAGESGSLLVSSDIYWSTARRPSLFKMEPLVRGPGFRGHYATRPHAYSATLCRLCEVCTAFEETATCEHEWEAGFAFPYSKLLWLAGDSKYDPPFLFPLTLRNRHGIEPEVLFSIGFPLTIGHAACPARKCARCGGVQFHYHGRRPN
jgi:hypothetical protein